MNGGILARVSQENVDLVREGYERFATGDIDGWLESLDPQIELDASRRHIDPGIFRGHDGIREFLNRQSEVWSGQRIEPEEYIDVGDSVVVPIRFVSTGRGSGIEVVARAAWVWDIRDGVVLRGTVYQSKADALDAVRLRK